MRSFLIESQLILEALQDNTPSDFDLLWRVLQSSEVQGYISQAELDRLFVDVAQSQGVDVASSLTHHLSQVLTVFPTENTPPVDVVLSHGTVPTPETVGKPPAMTVSSFLERLTLDLVYRNQLANSKNNQLLARWLRKYSDSSIDPFLAIPIAFTLLLQGLGVFDKVLGLLPIEEEEDDLPLSLSPVSFIKSGTNTLPAKPRDSVTSLTERRSSLFEAIVENLTVIAELSEDDGQTVKSEDRQVVHSLAQVLEAWSFEFGSQKVYVSHPPYSANQRERLSQNGPLVAGDFRDQEVIEKQSLRQVQASQSRSQGFGRFRVDPFLPAQRDSASQFQETENENGSDSTQDVPRPSSQPIEPQPVTVVDSDDYLVRIDASQVPSADFRVDISVDVSNERAPSVELLELQHDQSDLSRNDIAGIIADLFAPIVEQIIRESRVLHQTIDIRVDDPDLVALLGCDIHKAERNESSVSFNPYASNANDVFSDIGLQAEDFSRSDDTSNGDLSVDLIQIEVNLLNRDQVGRQREFGFDVALGRAMPQASELGHSGLETWLDDLIMLEDMSFDSLAIPSMESIMLELNCSINDRLLGTDHIGYAYRSDEGSVSPMGSLTNFEAFGKPEANLGPLISQV